MFYKFGGDILGNLYERIELLGKSRGFGNVTQLCQAAGVPRAIMTELKKGRSRDISKPTAQKLAAILGVSLDELYDLDAPISEKKAPATGEGEGKFIGYGRILGAYGSGVELIPEYENVLPIKTKRVPLLGEIACGEPIYAAEERDMYVEVGADVDVDFALKAHGDSMTGARIYDGDLVFIRRQSIVDNGRIAAVVIDDEATLKRVYYYPEAQKLVLTAENPIYEPLVYVRAELDTIKILGEAVLFQSRVR